MSIALYIFNSLLAGLLFDKMLARIVYLTTLIALSVIVYFGTLYLTLIGNFKHV